MDHLKMNSEEHPQITDEILAGFLGMSFAKLQPGQVPHHKGVQLFEKEYVGSSTISIDDALSSAVARFEEDHLGEHVYSRGAHAMVTEAKGTEHTPQGTFYCVIIVAAIRPLYVDFSTALTLLKRGASFSRKNWNGKGLKVYIQKFHEAQRLNPCFVLENGEGERNGWVPSITDLLADDWEQTV